jgi:putative glutamine amidotransferase
LLFYFINFVTEERAMKKPLIGIIGSLSVDQGEMFPGYERAFVNDDYVQAVAMAGGIPFILPLISDPDAIREQVESMDAVIISGGVDVNPLLYGEEPVSELGYLCPERDVYDLEAVRIILEMDKPVIGICRGMQIMNVISGGTLYQDLSKNEVGKVKHLQNSKPDLATHSVDVAEGTKLFGILGGSAMVNSYHHQAVKELAPGFRVSARAKDGIIEAIEKEEGFAIGVQWHPEMIARKDSRMLELFRELISRCS